MPVVQTKASSSKVITSEAWENTGPAAVVRVTSIPITLSTQLQLDGNVPASGTNPPLPNRRRVRIYSLAAPANPPAIQANVGFDTSVSATIGIPIYNFPGGFVELFLDVSAPIWVWPLATGTLELYEEAT
jgi:hypothetical protein